MQVAAAYQEPIHLTVTSDHPGNIFGSGDARELYLYLTNKTQQNLKGMLGFRYLTHSGEQLDEGEPVKFELSRGQEKKLEPVRIPGGIRRFDTYYAEVSMTVQSADDCGMPEKKYGPVRYDFSIMNKLEKGEEPNRAVRMNSHHGLLWGDPDIVFGLAREAGFSGVRDEYRWQHAETEKGNYACPEGARDWVSAAERQGLDALWILDYGNVLYGESNYDLPDDSRYPGTEEAFLKYVDWITSSFKGRIRYYQFWNEPDTKHFTNSDDNPGQYVRMLRRVYETVKKNDPSAKVVGLAISRHCFKKELAFVKEAVLAGAADYMDAASFHPYQFSREFSGRLFQEQIRQMREIFSQAGRPDMPFLITEMGIAAYPEGKWPDEYAAAAQTVQMWALAQVDPDVDAVYEFHFMNNHPSVLWENAASEQNRFGLINHECERVPYSARPGAVAGAAYNKLIGNARLENRYVKTLDSQGHQAYVLQMKREKDQKDVLIYWSECGSRTFGLKLGAERAEAFDMYSNPEGVLAAADGRFTLTASPCPSYLAGDFSEFEIWFTD